MGGIRQPDVEDSRWEIDEQRHFVGMDCSVEHNGEAAAGEVAAIWLFRGEPRARRRTARGRHGREHQQGAGQFRGQRLTRAPPFKPHRALVTEYQDRCTARRLRTGVSWTLLPKLAGHVKLSPISGSSAQFPSCRPCVGHPYRRATTVDMTESQRRQPHAEPQRRGGQYV